MIPSSEIAVGSKWNIIQETGLWDFVAYTQRTGTRWRGVYPDTELPAPLPPRTEGSERLAVLPPGTRITIRQPPDNNANLAAGILYHAARTANQNLAYQCLYAEVTIDGVARAGFVWTEYEGSSYIAPVANQPEVRHTIESRPNTKTLAKVVIEDWRVVNGHIEDKRIKSATASCYETQVPAEPPATVFIETPGPYELMGVIKAYEAYTPPDRQDSQALGTLTGEKHTLLIDDSIEIHDVNVRRVNSGEGTQKPYQVVSGNILRRCGKPVTDTATYFFLVVNEGVHKVRPATPYPACRGNLVRFYNDASETHDGSEGAFRDIENAINEAKHFIFIAGWSFHPLMRLTPENPKAIGKLLVDWANEQSATTGGRLVAIHTWDHTTYFASDPQNDDGNEILSVLGKPGNLLWRASSRSRTSLSHHQKLVVMDGPVPGDCRRRQLRAFLGGLDLTKGRFDWPEHLILPAGTRTNFLTDPKDGVELDGYRKVNEWYSAEFGDVDWSSTSVSSLPPRQPWHDVHCQITGPAAWDVLREFVGRWQIKDPSGAMGDTDDCHQDAVLKHYNQLSKSADVLGPKVAAVAAPGENPPRWIVQICRSIVREQWGRTSPEPDFAWRLGSRHIDHSIQDAYIQAIRNAQRFIYIETQYFIGSGAHWSNPRASVKNRIPETIVARIKERKAAGKPFHVYLILPMFPEGKPSSFPHSLSSQSIRDLQWQSIDYIVNEVAKVDSDWRKYLTIGFLANWHDVSSPLMTTGGRAERTRANQRYMIYVHSKLMIVDDRYVILGSANLNERSLAGDRDSEICAGMWPEPGGETGCIASVRAFRYKLWTEHFGAGSEAAWSSPESSTCVGAIQGCGMANYLLLLRGKHRDAELSKSGHFCMWELQSGSGLGIRANKDVLIVDGETGDITGDDWCVWPTDYLHVPGGATELLPSVDPLE